MNRRAFLIGSSAVGGLAIAGAAHSAFRPRAFQWQKLSSDGGFSHRDSAAGLKFQDRVWMSGGYGMNGSHPRDLLSSEDGINFEVVSAETPYNAFASLCVHNGKLVAFDGLVHSSADGLSWEVEYSTGDIPPYNPEAALVSHGGKLVLITQQPQGGLNSVYVRDGSTWTSYSAPWPSRVGYAWRRHRGRVYVMGGAANRPSPHPKATYPEYTSLNDVWSSDDPADAESWVCEHEQAPWAPRIWGGVISHHGWLYLTGGYSNELAKNFDDTWRFHPFFGWQELALDASFPARHAPKLYSHKGRLILSGGNTNEGDYLQQDVWELTPTEYRLADMVWPAV